MIQQNEYPFCPKGHPMVTDTKATDQMKLLKERHFVCIKCNYRKKVVKL